VRFVGSVGVADSDFGVVGSEFRVADFVIGSGLTAVGGTDIEIVERRIQGSLL